MTRVLIAVLALAACSVEQKKEVSDKAMDDPERRAELMEAQLRLMDENPQYVDEFFRYARRHPRTLDRFLANTARSLTDRELAQRVAKQLTAHPRGLQSVMVAVLDDAKEPGARAAISEAIETRANQAARILVEHPRQLGTVTKAILDEAVASPNTKTVIKEVVKKSVD